MCGIAGQIGFRHDVRRDAEVMAQMSAVLVPRGPDAGGEYAEPRAYLVHRRLIVVDPENGIQPMTAGNYTLVYNGELYNTEELRKKLMAEGVRFKGHSDTEVVLQSYIRWGADCAEMFNGIFAFAVWDSRKGQLFLCRDRIGVKPLFYSFTHDGIVFSSEIKALLKHPEIKPVITREGVMDIMLIGPAKRVGCGVFRDISEIPPAHYAFFDRDGFTQMRYWALKAASHTESFEETSSHVRELITDAVKRQLVSDVPLCCFLSGGLDSSIISAIAADEYRKRGEQLYTWSVDYKGNRENFVASAFQPDEDAPWITRMAEYIGSQHTNVELSTQQVAEALDDAVLARDLPGMADVDSSLLLFCREIKKQFPVALSGECADEIFGGYPWYHKKDVLFYDGFPWSTAVPERAALMKDSVSAAEAEEYVRTAYNETITHTNYLDSDNPTDRRMREMYLLNLEYFMATLLDRRVTKINPHCYAEFLGF